MDLVLKARDLVRDNGDFGTAIATVLVNTKADDYPMVYRRLDALSEFSSHLNKDAFPSTHEELSKSPNVFPDIGAQYLLPWIATTLSFHTKKIEIFLSFEKLIDDAAYQKRWDNALNYLDQLESSVGTSIWSLNRRLVLVERAKGIAAQKQLANSILDNEACHPRTKLFTAFFSAQAESAVSADSYYKEVSRAFSAKMHESPAYHYIVFHIAFFGPFSFSELGAILALEMGSSIIDRYCTFVRIGQMIYADSRRASHDRSYRLSLKLLGSEIVDVRLAWLRAVFGLSAAQLQARLSMRIVEAYDKYTCGDYLGALTDSKTLIESSEATSVELMELQAIAAARSGQLDSLLAATSGENLIARLHESRASMQESIASARKEISCFSQSRLAAILHSVVEKETSNFSRTLPVRYERLAEISGSASNPRALFFAGKKSEIVRRSLPPAVLLSSTYRLFRETASGATGREGGLERIPATRISKYKAHEAFRRNNNIKALAHFSTLWDQGDDIDKLDAAEGMTASYINLGQIPQASETLCRYVLAHTFAHRRFPVEHLCDVIEEKQKGLPKHQMPIEIPNVFGLYSQHYGRDREYRMGTICEDFLLSNSLRRPSDIQSLASRWDKTQLVFFLSQVCLISALDSHPVYENLQDIEDERVLILQWLLDLNPDERPTYAVEIAEITRRQKLRMAMQSVEKSKISVNVTGVKSILPAEALELHKRFKALPKFSLANLEDLIEQVAARDRSDKKVVIVLAADERTQVLQRFYELVRQRFLFSNDFGLDAYLSVGIRHIVMPGQFRACFERSDLLTSKDAQGNYAANEIWARLLSEQVLTPAQEALKKFSGQIDDLIEKLRNEAVQIHTEKRPKGLLRIELDPISVVKLDDQISASESFDSAVDAIIELLWEQTDASLRVLQNYLRVDFREKVDRTIDELESSVRAFGPQRLPNLEAAITTARTRFHDEVESVANWFVRGDTEPLEDFDFNFVLDMALAAVNRCYARKSLKMELAIEGENRFRAASLNPLLNILVVLLDNALRHGYVETGSVALSLEVQLQKPSLRLCAKNLLAEEKEPSQVATQLTEIRATVAEQTLPEHVRAEGGSGLVKIARIVRSDLRTEPHLEFGVTEEREFHASIDIKQEALWA